jgi:hypothetical protein
MTAPNGQAALDNARQVDNYSPGYCLKYVRAEAWRIGGLYASAIDAWHGAIKRHPGDRNAPIGAPMFYEGGQYGHIVVAVETERDRMRSTDMPYSGVVNEGDIDWPVNNWGQKYLGWTEDLNAVDLPLESEDEMTGEDWDKLRKIVREECERNNKPATDSVWDEAQTVTSPGGDDMQKSMRQIARETWQRVAKMA